MKRWLSAFSLVLVLVLPVAALAVEDTPGAATGQQTQLARIKTLADKQIDNRVTVLTNLLKLVQNSPHISSTDKANLTTQVQTEISSLPQLKTKIDNETDIKSVRADVQSIYQEFRVYALIVPKVNLIRVADRLATAADKLSAYADSLQQQLDDAKAKGKDTSKLQATMTDMRSQISTAKADFTAAVSKIMNVTPDQFNSDKSSVSQTRNLLKAGRDALKTALKDGNQIKSGLKQL